MNIHKVCAQDVMVLAREEQGSPFVRQREDEATSNVVATFPIQPRKHALSIRYNCLSGIGIFQLLRFLFCRAPSDVNRAARFLSWRYLHRIVFIWVSAVFNTVLGLVESLIYGQQIRQQPIDPNIVFILGHPRSGTTHLHNILTRDTRFGFVDTLQAFYPNCCFVMRGWLSFFLQLFMEDTRPMDQVPLNFNTPAEDESAINILTAGMSPYGVFSVAPRWRTYLKYLTLNDCTQQELEQWRSQLVWFLKKCTYACGGKPLIIKSPTHTARIPILREMFPRAKFVVIERNPEQVFASLYHLIQECYTHSFIAETNDVELTDFMIEHYRIVQTSFDKGKRLVPEHQMCSVSFEELDKDPHAILDRIYTHFGWDGVDHVHDLLKRYLHTIGPYQARNECLPDALRCRLQNLTPHLGKSLLQ